MGDRVAVLRGGVLQQLDRPQHVFEAPCNLFVASFSCSPPTNIVEARLDRSEGGDPVCALGAQKLNCRQEAAVKVRTCKNVSDDRLRWACGRSISKTRLSSLPALLFFEVPRYLRSLRVRRSSFTFQCR